MMGTLQSNFLPSVQGTEEFVLIFQISSACFLYLCCHSTFAHCFFSVTTVRSSEKIILLALDVHKEQIQVTRAFLPLQNGVCFTCPDFYCHCSILSVTCVGENRLSLEMMLMCSMHQLPLIAEAVTGLDIIFWQSKHLVEIAFWTWTLWHLLTDSSLLKNHCGPLHFFSFLKERRSGSVSSGSPAKWIILGSLFFHMFHLPSDPSDLVKSGSH